MKREAPTLRAEIDWEEIKRRLERSRRVLEAAGEPSAEEASRILRARARGLARPREEEAAPAEVVDLLVFALDGERYGIETAHVLGMIPLRGLVPVPSAPSFVLGLVNHRGQALPVLDLRGLFERAGERAGEGSRVVVVQAGAMNFGVLAEEAAGIVRVSAEELAHPASPPRAGRQPFLRGVTRDLIGILDLGALSRDPRIAAGEGAG